MNTLAEFLEARLAEDEAAARACLEMFPTPWEISDRGWRVRIYASEIPTEDFTSDDAGAMTVRYPVVMEVEPDRRIVDRLWLSDRVDHIVRHDPARVLAEVAAKRAVLAAYEDERQRKDIYNRSHDEGLLTTDGDRRSRLSSNARWAGLDVAVRYMVQVYSDHADFRPEWLPENW